MFPPISPPISFADNDAQVEIQVDLDEAGMTMDMMSASAPQEDGAFDMEMDDVSPSSSSSQSEADQVRKMVEKLDGVLFLVFEFLQTRWYALLSNCSFVFSYQ